MDFENDIFSLKPEEVRAAPGFPTEFSILEGEDRKEELLRRALDAKLEAQSLMSTGILSEIGRSRELLGVSNVLGKMCTQLIRELDTKKAASSGIEQLELFLRKNT